MGQQGSLENIRAPIGSRPSAVRDNRHESICLFHPHCPSRETRAAIFMPVAMSEHLKEIAAQVASHAMLVATAPAGTSAATGSMVPITSRLPITPYSPGLKRMENVSDYRNRLVSPAALTACAFR